MIRARMEVERLEWIRLVEERKEMLETRSRTASHEEDVQDEHTNQDADQPEDWLEEAARCLVVG